VDLTSSLNPSGLGDSVTFTATVSGTPTPTGTIQFQVDGVNAGSPVALDGGGVATFVTSSLTLGERIVDALYSGDATYQGGYDRVFQHIANNQPVASVQNGSFETEVLTDGTRNFFSDAVWKLTGWTKFNGNFTGQGYFQNYSSAQLTSEYGGNPLPDGEQVLGLGRGGLNEAASVYQDLGTVSTGNTYTLAGQLGRPATQGLNEVDSATGYYMELYVGDTWEEARNTTPILSLDKTDVPDPALGDWDAWSGTSSAITAEQNGKHLYVRLYVNPGPTFPSIREFDDISVTVNSGSPYASWSQFYFSTPSADPNDDPDFDGASNLLEYGAGTVPNQPNPSSTPVNYAVASGNSNLSITFTLVESATDLSYIVQTSTNLSTWTDEATYVPTGSGYSRTGTGTTQTADVDNGTTRTLTEQASAPVGTNARRFIRVKVVK
ncbi:MAG: Ig-like domain-containing protein, partial [Akkermansiaceae bacterium]|nr:Ig-like domain-containing protein [Akkermansiaceae bacterium]